MKTPLRWLLLAAGTIIVLALASGLAALILIDPNDYRGEIETVVEQQTGRQLSISGELEFRAFPCCGLKLGPLGLSNPPGWREPDFASVERAEVSVRLWPLLTQRELQVGEILLEGLDVKLLSRADGTANWNFGGGAEPTNAAESDGSGMLSGLDIAGVKISDSRLSFSDAATGEQLSLAEINLSAGAVAAGRNVKISGSLLAQGLAPDTEVRVNLSSTAQLSSESLQLSLTGTQVQLELKGKAVPAAGVDINVQVDSVAGIGSERIAFAGLAATLAFGSLDLSLEGSGELADGSPEFSGTAKLAPFSPRKLMQELGEQPPATVDPAVLEQFALQTRWELDADSLRLNKIVATLDDSRITGRIKFASSEEQKHAAKLTLDALDADRYMAPTDDPGQEGSGAASSEELDLPVEALRELKLDASLNIGALVFSGLHLSDVTMTLKAGQGRIRMYPVQAQLYGGSYAGDSLLNVRGAQPKLSVNESLTAVTLGDLLSDAGADIALTGLGNASIKATAAGNTVNELLERLSGNASFQMQDGIYHGVDLWHEIRTARARLKKIDPPATPESPQTELQKFSGTMRFAKGVLKNRDFTAQIPFMRLKGKGDVNLLDATLDYTLEARVIETPVFADGEELKSLKGLALPITIKGAMDSPSVGVNIQKLAVSLGEKKLTDRLLKKFDLLDEPEADSSELGGSTETTEGKQSSEDLKEQLKKKLRGLLGG
jgi:AsmA protein